MYTVLRAKIGFKGGIKETWGVGREIFFPVLPTQEMLVAGF
jgi:hypothetical protein